MAGTAGVLREMLLGLERDISEIQMLADDRSFEAETSQAPVVLSAVRDLMSRSTRWRSGLG